VGALATLLYDLFCGFGTGDLDYSTVIRMM